MIPVRDPPAPLYPDAAEKPYRDFLRAAFAERRKMVWKNLASRAKPAALDAAYATLGIPRNARAEELSPSKLFALFEQLKG